MKGIVMREFTFAMCFESKLITGSSLDSTIVDYILVKKDVILILRLFLFLVLSLLPPSLIVLVRKLHYQFYSLHQEGIV